MGELFPLSCWKAFILTQKQCGVSNRQCFDPSDGGLTPPPTVLEVHQFSRDAGVAEAWLLGQEPYLSSREMGQSVDEVEKLIKRHEAFEKSAATWEERFSALERLTTVSRRGQKNPQAQHKSEFNINLSPLNHRP